jgi:predicted dehydrogenase
LQYDDEFVAHLHLNWIAPVKVRTIMLGGTNCMAVYDENIPTEKIKIYNKGIVLDHSAANKLRVSYRVGDMIAPAISNREALQGSLAAFHRFLTRNEKPISDGEHGRRIVEVLEAATRSLSAGGIPIHLEESRPLNRELAA